MGHRAIVLLVLLALATPVAPPAASGPLHANDECAGAVDISDGGTWTGANVFATDDYRSRDGYGALQPDVVFSFELPAVRRVVIDLAQSDHFVLAYIRTDCEDPSTEVAARSWLGGQGTGPIGDVLPQQADGPLILNLPAGDYSLILDGEGGAGIPYRVGDYVLDFSTAQPAVTDLCAVASALSPGTTTGDTRTLGDDHRSPSVGSAGPDAVYRLNVGSRRTVTIDTAGSTFDTTIYVRSDCDEPASELAAADDTPSGLQARLEITVDAGVYWLFVDGWDGSAAGLFEVHLS